MKQLLYITPPCIVLWLLVHTTRWNSQPIPFVNDHLTDVIATPFIAACCVTVLRLWVIKRADYQLPFAYILFIAAYLSIAFEIVMPHYSSRYTADWRDSIAYFAGGIGYYYFVKPAHRITSETV